MEIRFLGPFDVVDADAPDLGRRWKAARAPRDPRSARGEVVPVGRLIDELWPDDPPDSALNTLQAYVSRLRKTLRPDQPPEGKRFCPSMGAIASTSRRTPSTRTVFVA